MWASLTPRTTRRAYTSPPARQPQTQPQTTKHIAEPSSAHHLTVSVEAVHRAGPQGSGAAPPCLADTAHVRHE